MKIKFKDHEIELTVEELKELLIGKDAPITTPIDISNKSTTKPKLTHKEFVKNIQEELNNKHHHATGRQPKIRPRGWPRNE